MLVNIWASVTHLGDAYFAGAQCPQEGSLDLELCDGLGRATDNKQTWMINAVWRTPGTSAVLLRESYTQLRDSNESYLMLITPGFSDIVAGVPLEQCRRQWLQLCRRARCFNKRVIACSLGMPPGASPDVAEQIQRYNKMVTDVSKSFGGAVCDLTNATYAPWDQQGSRPAPIAQLAEPLVDSVIGCHSQAEEWRTMRAKR